MPKILRLPNGRRGELVTSPRDPRLVDGEHYGALALTAAEMRGFIRTASAHGAEVVIASNHLPYSGEADDIPLDVVQETARSMLATGMGERYPLPDSEHEIVVLRFIVDAAPLSLVYIEDYDRPYPAVVDGHVIDRDEAIDEWLGDTDGSDHPDLFPFGTSDWR
jgi:hypothetical protein